MILSATIALTAIAQNPNERFSFNMKDGSAATVKVSKLAGMMPVKYDVKGNPTDDYQTFVLVTKDGQGAALPLNDILRINHIKGEPTDGMYGATWYEIQREWNEHSEVVMLNSINNYNNGKGVITQEYDNNWCGQRSGFPVYFLATSDMGYDVDFEVRGLDSGFIYSDYSGFVFWLAQNDEMNPCGQSCWCFYMGEEPVVITAKATENQEYDQYPWLGDYYGHPVALTEDFLYKGTNNSLTRLSLKGNGSYIFSSNALEVPVTSSMLYTYEDKAFRYKLDESGDLTWRGDQDYYGMVGYWITDELMYLRAENLNVNAPGNNRRYFVLKDAKPDFTMTVGAKDNWNGRATKYLAELYYDGAYHYYFLDNYGAAIYEATLTYTTGNTISAACDATVTYVDNNGVEQKFRYVSEDGTNPQFLSIEDPDPEDEKGAEWTGPSFYKNEAATGVYDNTESSKHKMYIRMNQDPNGGKKDGYCSLRVDMSKGYSYDSYFISTSGTYVYNAKAKTITVKDLLVGIDGGGNTERRTLVFKLSDDLQSISIEGEKLYGSRTNTYIYTGDTNILTAAE